MRPPPAALILDAGANDQLDITSAEMLTQLADTMRSARIDVALADVREPVIEMAHRSGLLDQLGKNRVFPTIDAAVEATTRRASSRLAEGVEVP